MLDLFVEDGFQVFERHLVPAFGAGVFGAIGGHIHLLPTVAVCEAREQVDGGFRGPLKLRPLTVQVMIALVPEFLGHDGFHGDEHPFILGLQYPGPRAVCGVIPGVVRAAGAFGGRVAEETVNRRVRELAPVAGPVPHLIEHSGNDFLPLVFPEQFIHELPNRGFLRIDQKLFVLPLVAIDCLSASWLPILCADRHCCSDALGDLFAFPLRHRRDHRVEEATGRGRSVDRFSE